jgi:hypothetical protein
VHRLLFGLLVLALAAPAQAGRLDDLVDGLGDKKDSDPPSHDSDDDDVEVDDDDEDYEYDDDNDDDDAPAVQLRLLAPPYPSGAEVTLDMHTGMGPVFESDLAVHLAATLMVDRYALEVADTIFIEDTPERLLDLHSWRVALGYKAIGDDDSELWLYGGVAGIAVEGLDFFGGTLAAEMRHRLSARTGINAVARGYVYDSDVRALEASVGFAATFLRVNYRIYDNNAGPVLHGPELAFAWRWTEVPP